MQKKKLISKTVIWALIYLWGAVFTLQGLVPPCSFIGVHIIVLVQDTEGTPISGATVILSDQPQGSTNIQGYYDFNATVWMPEEGCPADRLRIEASGFLSNELSINELYRVEDSWIASYIITLESDPPRPPVLPCLCEWPVNLAMLVSNRIFSVDEKVLVTVYMSNNINLAACEFEVNYDPAILNYIETTSMPDNIFIIAEASTPGRLLGAGFHTQGKGPAEKEKFFTITFETLVEGTSDINMTVKNLFTADHQPIALPDVSPISVSISNLRFGDVNGDFLINIVDALMVAQYVVQLPVPGFNTTAADVNNDSNIDIVDALIIARFSVGLIIMLPL